jgi:DNA-binding IclR family transcriptional regulator
MDEDGGKSPESYGSSTVLRAIDLLEAFTAHAPALSLKDISEITGLHKATALRLLKTLAVRGFVNKDPLTSRYSLGFKLLSMAEIAKGESVLVSQALPALRKVRDALDETVFISVRVGDHRIDIEQVEGLQETRQVKRLGQEYPLYAGAPSKLLLAWMSDPEIENYLARTPLKPFTPRTIVDPIALRAEVAKIRKLGYSEGSDETRSGGASASAPITRPDGGILAAVTLTAPRHRFTAALRKKSIVAIQDAAQEISSNLSGSGPGRGGGGLGAGGR